MKSIRRSLSFVVCTSIFASCGALFCLAQSQSVSKNPSLPNTESIEHKGPFCYLDIAASIASGTPSSTLVREIAGRGWNSYFEDADVEGFRAIGGTKEVIEALGAAHYVWLDPKVCTRRKALAEAEFRSLLAKRPSDPALHLWLGKSLAGDYQNQGDRWSPNSKGKGIDDGQAVAEIRKSIALGLELPLSYASLGDALCLGGNLHDALQELRESIRRKPNLRARADIVYITNQTDARSGLEEAREAMREAPELFYSHFILALELQVSAGKTPSLRDEAIRELHETLRLNPSFPLGHLALGENLYVKGSSDQDVSALQEAVLELREASRLGYERPLVHVLAADCLARSGQPEEAIAEWRTMHFYVPDYDLPAKRLGEIRAKMGGSAPDSNRNSDPSQAPAASDSASLSVVGSAWNCQWTVFIHGVQTNPDGSRIPITTEPESEESRIDFRPDGIAVRNGQQWSESGGPAHWVQQGAIVHISIPTTFNFDLEGTLSGDSIAGRPVVQPSMAADFARLGYSSGPDGTFSCRRSAPPLPPSNTNISISNAANPSISASKGGRPHFQTRCIHTVQGPLGQMTLTNICSQPVDVKWCYRKHGSGDRYECQLTTLLYQNHTLETPKCYQCSYDVRFATYFSSENLSGSMPSDEEMNAYSTSSSGGQANNIGDSGSSVTAASDQKRWRVVNPGQNWSSLTFEARGRSGESTSDEWNDETPLVSVTLRPGDSYELDCDQWFSLDIKWQLSSAERTDGLDTFWASLVCYANNPTWRRANNVREYDFPRQ